MKGGVIAGWGYFWRGAESLLDPRLRSYVVLPLLLNIVIMGAASIWVFSTISGVLGGLIAWLPGWLSWLYWFILPLMAAFLVFSCAYFFGSILIILASPLNGLLAEKVEALHGETIPDEPILQMIARTFGREIIKVLYYVPRYIGLLVLAFIPGIQLLVPFFTFIFGGWVAALQYVDYSYDNHARPFMHVRLALAKDRSTALGFGITVALLMSVPIVNWFVMPAAVIGATLLRLDRLALDPMTADGPVTVPDAPILQTTKKLMQRSDQRISHDRDNRIQSD